MTNADQTQRQIVAECRECKKPVHHDDYYIWYVDYPHDKSFVHGECYVPLRPGLFTRMMDRNAPPKSE